LNALQSIVEETDDFEVGIFERLCLEQGSEEALWLLKMSRTGKSMRRAIARSKEASPWALYYQWWVTHEHAKLLLSASLGFPPAMSRLNNYPKEYEQGAYAGNLACLNQAGFMPFEDQLLRFIHFQGCIPSQKFTLQAIVEALYVKKNFNRLFTIGRRCSDVREICNEYRFMCVCIDTYRYVTEKSRRSALYTVFVFKQLFSRDLAPMMGRAVYATRLVDANAWMEPLRTLKKVKV